jgi:ketosteroid isomerase-like protein
MSQPNIELVQRGYAAFGKGDLDGLLATMHGNIQWKTPGGADVPTAGSRRGHAEVRDFFKVLGELVEFQNFEPQTFIADADRVVVLGIDTFTVKGGSGKSLTEPWCHVFTVRDGSVVEFQEYIDTAAFAAELKTIAAVA